MQFQVFYLLTLPKNLYSIVIFKAIVCVGYLHYVIVLPSNICRGMFMATLSGLYQYCSAELLSVPVLKYQRTLINATNSLAF